MTQLIETCADHSGMISPITGGAANFEKLLTCLGEALRSDKQAPTQITNTAKALDGFLAYFVPAQSLDHALFTAWRTLQMDNEKLTPVVFHKIAQLIAGPEAAAIFTSGPLAHESLLLLGLRTALETIKTRGRFKDAKLLFDNLKTQPKFLATLAPVNDRKLLEKLTTTTLSESDTWPTIKDGLRVYWHAMDPNPSMANPSTPPSFRKPAPAPIDPLNALLKAADTARDHAIEKNTLDALIPILQKPGTIAERQTALKTFMTTEAPTVDARPLVFWNPIELSKAFRKHPSKHGLHSVNGEGRVIDSTDQTIKIIFPNNPREVSFRREDIITADQTEAFASALQARATQLFPTAMLFASRVMRHFLPDAHWFVDKYRSDKAITRWVRDPTSHLPQDTAAIAQRTGRMEVPQDRLADTISPDLLTLSHELGIDCMALVLRMLTGDLPKGMFITKNTSRNIFNDTYFRKSRDDLLTPDVIRTLLATKPWQALWNIQATATPAVQKVRWAGHVFSENYDGDRANTLSNVPDLSDLYVRLRRTGANEKSLDEALLNESAAHLLPQLTALKNTAGFENALLIPVSKDPLLEALTNRLAQQFNIEAHHPWGPLHVDYAENMKHHETLSAAERWMIVHESHRFDPEKIATLNGRPVIYIGLTEPDGMTLAHAQGLAREAGAKDVGAVFLARLLRRAGEDAEPLL